MKSGTRQDPPTREFKGRTQIYTRGAWRYAEESECWHCGKKFWYNKYKNDAGRYCSATCVGKETAKRYRREAVYLKCVICSTVFRVQPSKQHRYKTCGRSYCQQTYKRRVGVANWAARQEKQRLRFVALREARNKVK